MNNYAQSLTTILNFNLLGNESNEERIEKMSKFRKELSYDKYKTLFDEISEMLENDSFSLKELDEITNLLYEVIMCFPKFYDNLNLFPKTILYIFNSLNNLQFLTVLLEELEHIDVVSPVLLENLVMRYKDFLETIPTNILNLITSNIIKFNERLINYINRDNYRDYINSDIVLYIYECYNYYREEFSLK